MLLAMFQTVFVTDDGISSSTKVVVVSAIMIYNYENTNLCSVFRSTILFSMLFIHNWPIIIIKSYFTILDKAYLWCTYQFC